MIDLYPVQGGLTFDALQFESLKPAPLPTRVSIQVDKQAQLSVASGDHVLTGQPLHLDNPMTQHASISGVVSCTDQNLVTIESDGQDNVFSHKIKTPESAKQFENICRQMGLVGLGGACYPVHAKLKSVRKVSDYSFDTLLINAAECDPAIYCDEALILSKAKEVASAITLVWKISGAKTCIVGIEENKTAAIEQLNQHLPTEVKIVCVPAIYPSGAESILYKLCTGKTGGLRDNNSLCFNLATCHSIYMVLQQSQPLISRVVTVVTKATVQNLEVRLGTSVKDLASSLAIPFSPSSNEVIHGGKMMGVPVDQNYKINKSTNSLIFKSLEKRVPLPCIRCGACLEVCPVNLSPQHLHWHSASSNYSALTALKIDSCIECASCDQVCPSHIELGREFSQAKQLMEVQKETKHKADLAKQRYENRLNRLEQQSAAQRKKLDYKSTMLSQSDSTDKLKKDLIAKALQKNKSKKPSPKKQLPDHE